MSETPISMATAEQVWPVLREAISPLSAQSVPVRDSLGCVLASDIAAAFDYPPFDRAVMDGYAVRSADFKNGTARLRCLGLAAAGDAAALHVESGTCVQINTGGPVPAGADAIVIVEQSSRESPEWVVLNDHPKIGQHKEMRGGILARGHAVAKRGTRIQGGTLAAIVSAGSRSVLAYPSPRVSLLCTGDELVDVGGSLGTSQIYDSNSTVLDALVRAENGQIVAQARSGDSRPFLLNTIQSLLSCDLLVITGGMSKGSLDLVPSVLEEMGITWLVTSLDLKPGKPTRIGRMPSGVWVLGLPGNPVSCAVCFLLFGRAILRGLQGQAVDAPPRLRGTLQHAVPANGARPMYHPAQWLPNTDGALLVDPIRWRGSGDPFGLSVANALLMRDRNAPPAAVGDQAWFVPLDVPISQVKV